ncbi:MAG: SDR family NAD(P)-dependent oxidoreductase [Microthrixaceae bacterium]
MGAALKGSTALVTGGGSGIGLGAAKAFAVDGASVLIVGRSQDKLDAALEELSPLVHDGASVSSLSTDVTEESQVEAAVAAAGELPGNCRSPWHRRATGPSVRSCWHPRSRSGTGPSVSLRGVFSPSSTGTAIAANGAGVSVAVSSLAGLLTHRFMGPLQRGEGSYVTCSCARPPTRWGQVRANGVEPWDHSHRPWSRWSPRTPAQEELSAQSPVSLRRGR